MAAAPRAHARVRAAILLREAPHYGSRQPSYGFVSCGEYDASRISKYAFDHFS